MKDERKRALELAEIIASNELPWSKSIQEARQELSEAVKKLDSQTLKEVMERVRGFSTD